MNSISLEKILKSSRRAMLIGIGGGGDIVGTIPTAGLLSMFGIDCLLGGLSWERPAIDPVPGPRTFEETKNADKLNDVVWYCGKDTTTSTGVVFAESRVSEVLGVETLLIDINQGPVTTAKGIIEAAEKLSVDLIVGIDVGGDAIATGTEKGILSPLADSIMIASLYEVGRKIRTVIGVLGFGSDGELTISELESSIKQIAVHKGIMGSWGITPDILKLMEKVIKVVPTEASRSPVEYARGEFEAGRIRSGTKFITLNFSSTVTIYIDPAVLFEKISVLARLVAKCTSIENANNALHEFGIKSELDLERKRSVFS